MWRDMMAEQPSQKVHRGLFALHPKVLRGVKSRRGEPFPGHTTNPYRR